MIAAFSMNASARTTPDLPDGAGIVEGIAPTQANPGTSLLVLGVQLALAFAAAWIVRSRHLHRPGPGRLPPAESPSISPEMLLMGALMLWLPQMLGLASAVHLLNLDRAGDPTLRETALSMAGHYAGFAAGLGVLCLAMPGLPAAIGLRAHRLGVSGGVIGSIVLVPIVVALGTVLGQLVYLMRGSVETTAHSGLAGFVASDDRAMRVLFGVLVVTAAPVAEEVFYRGLVQAAFLRATRSAWTAILATSAIFVFMHVPIVEWYALPALFALSVGLGVAAERTRGLLAPMIIHAAFNLLNLGFAMLTASA